MCFHLMEALFPQSVKKKGGPGLFPCMFCTFTGLGFPAGAPVCSCSLKPYGLGRGNSLVPVGLSICITSCDRLWTCQEKRVACLLPSACWEKGLLSRCAPNKLSGLENGCMLLYDAFPDLVLLYFSLCFIIYVSFDFQSTPSPELFFFLKL